MSSEWTALVGVVLGGAFGFGGTYFTHRSAHREHRLTRWDDARLRAYFDYGAAVKAEVRTCDRIAAWHGYRDGATPLDPASGAERLAREADTRTMLLEQVRLVATEATEVAARDLQEAAWALHKVVLGSGDDAERRYLDSFKNVGEVRARFYVAARHELQVGGS